MLKTNVGVDLIFQNAFGTAAQAAAANYIALTASTVAPVATDTALAGEIATARGGLLRAQAVYSHSAASGGTGTATLAGRV